jgi:four helix bundle protein
MSQPKPSLVVVEVALAAVERLGPMVRRVAEQDRHLGDQLKRAAQSMALNLGEAAGSRAGNRRARLETALGSTYESRVALRIAAAWGYVDARDARAVDGQLDRVAAMTWRWLHR